MKNGISARTDNGTILATVDGGARLDPIERAPAARASMNTVRDLKLMPIWVNPQHLAITALHIMLGHKIKSIGVVDGERLVGIVSLEDLVATPEDAQVGQLMRIPSLVIEAGTKVRDVAEVFAREDLDVAAVVDQGRFLGMLTPSMLLKELGRSYDPLTTLSWSDHLRQWGIEHLKSNDEVTIIFIDLDDFGLYNKKYGHIVGDKVIAKVASFLSRHIDPTIDVLVRYGGDEFAIGTLRGRAEADAMAELLTRRFDGAIEGADEPVSFSAGVFGGRRNKERENVHYAATIDNLINIASKNCIRNKKREHGQAETVRPTLEFRVLGIYADDEDSSGIITVVLRANGNVYSGADSRRSKGVVDSIATATARAMERATPGIRHEVLAIDLLEEDNVQVVSVTGVTKDAAGERPVSAAKRVGGDLASVVAEVTLEAFSA